MTSRHHRSWKVFSGLNVVSTICFHFEIYRWWLRRPPAPRFGQRQTHQHTCISLTTFWNRHTQKQAHTWQKQKHTWSNGNHPSIPRGSSHSCTRSLASILFGRTTRVSDTSFPWRQEGLMLMLAALVTLLLLAYKRVCTQNCLQNCYRSNQWVHSAFYVSVFSSWSVLCFPS